MIVVEANSTIDFFLYPSFVSIRVGFENFESSHVVVALSKRLILHVNGCLLFLLVWLKLWKISPFLSLTKLYIYIDLYNLS